jgi:DNA-binding response OmpR family regulator
MFSILVITEENGAATELRSRLAESGFACYLARDGDEAVEQFAEQAPDLVLVEMDGHSRVWELSKQTKLEKHPPIIALVHRELLDNVDGHLSGIDDFVVKPYSFRELELRIKRLLQATNSDELISCGDLMIDLARYEVSLAGKPIELTFREYELLKFLASNRGRVYTRESLLNKVWGYDYYGGDRTVDVHIRRLRSKIEDSSHAFIETVRNIGYRFKDNV